MKFAEIIIDLNNKNVDRIFHYTIPENIKNRVKLGMRVFVPFGKGNKLREGYVIGFCEKTDIAESLLKEIHSLPDMYTIFNENMIDLAKFMSNKYYCTLSECLQCIMPKIVNDRTFKYVSINSEMANISEEIEKIIFKNNLQSKVLIFLKNQNTPFSLNELKKILNISLNPINSLLKKGIIILTNKEIKRNIFDLKNFEKTKKLNNTLEQENVINFIKDNLNSIDKKPTLLQGVTGSGKTEVYLQVIEEVLNQGKQAIMLVPEISLTPQTIERFIGRFGEKVSINHSKLNNGERLDQWKKAKNNEISIMIGVRSAIFTPFENLGIIIIDEAHESTYKSEITPKYSTIEIAEKISEQTDCFLLLGSATPSIETYFKAQKNKYNLIKMTKRINNNPPNIHIIDMRNEFNTGNNSIFSKQLFNAIKENLKNKLQTILFLNRRGYYSFISCRQCGHVMECKNCNISYTYHLSYNKLLCHYCNQIEKVPKNCPDCNSIYIKYFGIGTQKVETEVKRFFPEAKVMRMDLDTTSKKNSHQQILQKFKNKEIDILIGTQMIAKGLDFPNVSLVGVIAADLALNYGDYKSSENCFQVLTQVSGRAGRSKVKGNVFIQTYSPDHYSIKFAKTENYEGFYKKEIFERQINFQPPFSNIFFIMISGKNEEKVKKTIYKLNKIMLYYNSRTNFQISEPAKTTIFKLNKQFRYKIVVKAKEEERLKNFVLYCVERLKSHINTNDIYISLSLNPNFIQ